MVSWQDVLDGIDAVESWIVAQSFWVQVVLILVVLGPICWLVAGLIDRFVEWVLRRHRSRQARLAQDDPASDQLADDQAAADQPVPDQRAAAP